MAGLEMKPSQGHMEDRETGVPNPLRLRQITGRTSYYSNHYNVRLDNIMEIRLKSLEEIRWQHRLEYALFKKEWKWIALLLAAEYLNLVMHNFIYWLEGQLWDQKPPPALKDLGIMLFGDRLPNSASWIVGLFLYFMIAMVLALCLGRMFLNNVPWGCPQVELFKRGDNDVIKSVYIPVPFVYVTKRACQVLSIALILRVMSYMVTLDPNPAAYCHEPYWDPPHTIAGIFGRIEVTGSCGDLLFSSHTTHGMVMCMLCLRNAKGFYLVSGIAVISMTLLPIALLAFKNHYSHDIIVAIYTTWMIWKLMPSKEEVVDCDKLGIEFPATAEWKPSYFSS